MREDLFTVVFEQVRTDTAVYADVVLPATTFLEHYDVNRSYGGFAMQLTKPVIEPVGESRSNMEVFSELAGAARTVDEGADPEDDAETLLRVVHALPDDDARGAAAPTACAVPPCGPIARFSSDDLSR